MLQDAGEPDFDWQVRGRHPLRPILVDTLKAVQRLELHFDILVRPIDPSNWFDGDALALPQSAAFATLERDFKAHGLATNRKAASASLLLRFGWAGGFAIAAYLACARVPFLRNYAISFSPTMLLKLLWIRDARFVCLYDDALAGGAECIASVEANDLRRHLLKSLIQFTEPVVATQHEWSRFSRHALWAMATSSWAEQFVSIARQIGDEARGVREARAVFQLASELSQAAPTLYEVRGETAARTCQVRRACCLYFKGTTRYFCASCPIISESERLERNRAWIAQSLPPTIRLA
jgi:hypothetical protein